MNRTTLVAGLFGALALAGAAIASPQDATAAEAMPAAVAHHLDGQVVEFTVTAAKQRRLMIMENTMRQQRYGNRGHGYGRGYGPRPGYGYSRGYGHGRGYGPRPSYGYRRY